MEVYYTTNDFHFREILLVDKELPFDVDYIQWIELILLYHTVFFNVLRRKIRQF